MKVERLVDFSGPLIRPERAAPAFEKSWRELKESMRPLLLHKSGAPDEIVVLGDEPSLS